MDFLSGVGKDPVKWGGIYSFLGNYFLNPGFLKEMQSRHDYLIYTGFK